MWRRLLLDGYVLEAIDLRGVGDEEEGADGAGAGEFARRGETWRLLRGIWRHLAELLGEGHLLAMSLSTKARLLRRRQGWGWVAGTCARRPGCRS